MRKDRKKYGSGLIEYVQKGLFRHRLIEHHPIECICSELIIANKNVFISVSIDLQNLLTTFFYEVAITLSKALRKCENNFYG